MGVDLCSGDPSDADRLTSIQIEQQRADGKAGKEISRPSRNPKDSVGADEKTDDDFSPSEDEVQVGDDHVPSKTSKSTTTQSRKNKKLVALLTCLM